MHNPMQRRAARRRPIRRCIAAGSLVVVVGAGPALARPATAPAPPPAAEADASRVSPPPSVSAPIRDAELIDMALHHCPHLSRKRRAALDEKLLHHLLDAERGFSVPEAFRGMTLAKACIESGFNPEARGDCNREGRCRAVGIFQLWPWTTRFGIDRTDPQQAARFLLSRVELGAKTKVRHWCRGVRRHDDRWRVAWLRVNRGPWTRDREPRCDGKPHGLRMLQRWQRQIRRERREAIRSFRKQRQDAPHNQPPQGRPPQRTASR